MENFRTTPDKKNCEHLGGDGKSKRGSKQRDRREEEGGGELERKKEGISGWCMKSPR